MGTIGFHKKEAEDRVTSTSWEALFAGLEDFNAVSAGRAHGRPSSATKVMTWGIVCI